MIQQPCQRRSRRIQGGNLQGQDQKAYRLSESDAINDNNLKSGEL